MFWFSNNWSFKEYVIPLWNEKKYFKASVQFVNRVPQYTVWWGKRGDIEYDIDWANFGDEDFFGRGWKIAWWRECCHFIGGIFLGIIFPWYVIMSLSIINEINDLIEEKKSLLRVKPYFDILSWTLGAILVSIL